MSEPVDRPLSFRPSDRVAAVWAGLAGAFGCSAKEMEGGEGSVNAGCPIMVLSWATVSQTWQLRVCSPQCMVRIDRKAIAVSTSLATRVSYIMRSWSMQNCQMVLYLERRASIC